MLVGNHLSLWVTPRALALKRHRLYEWLSPGFVAGLPHPWKQELSRQLQNSFAEGSWGG